MRYRSLLFLAISTLALPCAARVDPETPACTINSFKMVEIVLPNLIIRRMRSLPSKYGQDAAAVYAANPGVPMQLGFLEPNRADEFERPVMPSSSFMMAWMQSHRRFLMAHWLLHSGSGDETTFVNDAKAQTQLADLVAPMFVHEASHFGTMVNLPRMTQSFRETEILAFYRQMLFLLDMLGKNPSFAGHDAAMRTQIATRKKIKEAEAAVKKKGGLRPDEAKRLEAELEAVRDEYEKKAPPALLSDLILLDALARSNDAFEKRALEVYGPGLLPAARLPEILAATRRTLEDSRARLAGLRARGFDVSRQEKEVEAQARDLALIDGAALGLRLEKEHQPLIAALRKEADARRARGELNAFKGDPEDLKYVYGPAVFEAFERVLAPKTPKAQAQVYRVKVQPIPELSTVDE